MNRFKTHKFYEVSEGTLHRFLLKIMIGILWDTVKCAFPENNSSTYVLWAHHNVFGQVSWYNGTETTFRDTKRKKELLVSKGRGFWFTKYFVNVRKISVRKSSYIPKIYHSLSELFPEWNLLNTAAFSYILTASSFQPVTPDVLLQKSLNGLSSVVLCLYDIKYRMKNACLRRHT